MNLTDKQKERQETKVISKILKALLEGRYLLEKKVLSARAKKMRARIVSMPFIIYHSKC